MSGWVVVGALLAVTGLGLAADRALWDRGHPEDRGRLFAVDRGSSGDAFMPRGPVWAHLLLAVGGLAVLLVAVLAH